MAAEREQRIRERAYAIWQSEGQPEGREHLHWDQASRDVDAADSVGSAPGAPRQKAAKKADPAAKPATKRTPKPKAASENKPTGTKAGAKKSGTKAQASDAAPAKGAPRKTGAAGKPGAT